MARYKVSLGTASYAFADLTALLYAASPARTGDEHSPLFATSAEHRVAAQLTLADVPLSAFLEEQLIPYEDDEVTRLIVDDHDPVAFAPLRTKSVGAFRDWLLAYDTQADQLAAAAPGITPEMASAVSKVMSNQDLALVASKVQVTTAFRDTIGLPGRMSSRLQPNHPTDDPAGILASVLDGLACGTGDAVIGINPANDDAASARRILDMLDAVISRFEIPTQACVLAHVTTMLRCMGAGAPVDLVFQSIAGTEAANRAFGVDLALLGEAHTAALELGRGGEHVMYFETGQGACRSSNADHGLDQQTLEARAYAVARRFQPLLVNTVVGFIGPEYLGDARQITRAGLEDHFCGKLLGLPMGVDVCYTNHVDADQNDNDVLLTVLAAAGCSFVMAVPGADDVMLGYQSTSHHDVQYVRQLLGKRPAPEFEAWLVGAGITDESGQLQGDGARALAARAQRELA